MEWVIIPIVLMALLCPIMMVGMIVGGWIFGRRAMGSHSTHGICMGHGEHQPGGRDQPATK